MTEEFKKGLQKLLGEFKEKLGAIRSHRLSVSFLENIEFSLYGGKHPLKAIAHLSQLAPLRFRVELWDKDVLPEVERELMNRGGGLGVQREGNGLVVTFPPMSEENRRQIIKELNQLKEEVRIRSRRERDDCLKQLKQQKESGQASEDAFFKGKEQADKEIEKFNSELEKVFGQKEREILE